jgi:uncharacterized membrane protein YgcG
MDEPRLPEDVRLAWDALAREAAAHDAAEAPSDAELDLTDRFLTDLAAGLSAGEAQLQPVADLLLAVRAPAAAEELEDRVGFATLVNNLHSPAPVAAAAHARRPRTVRHRLDLLGRALAAKAAIIAAMTVVGVAGAGAATGLIAVAVSNDPPPTTAPAPTALDGAPDAPTIGGWTDDEAGVNPQTRTRAPGIVGLLPFPSLNAVAGSAAPPEASDDVGTDGTSPSSDGGSPGEPVEPAEPGADANAGGQGQGQGQGGQSSGGPGGRHGNGGGPGSGGQGSSGQGQGRGGHPSPGSNGAANGNSANAGGSPSSGHGGTQAGGNGARNDPGASANPNTAGNGAAPGSNGNAHGGANGKATNPRAESKGARGAGHPHTARMLDGA